MLRVGVDDILLNVNLLLNLPGPQKFFLFSRLLNITFTQSELYFLATLFWQFAVFNIIAPLKLLHVKTFLEGSISSL